MIMEIAVDESWREETAAYVARIDSGTDLSSEVKSVVKTYWPGHFFPRFTPTRAALVAIRLGLYANGVFSVAVHVSRAVKDLWVSGLFVIVPLNTRFVVESWGGVHYAKKTLERLIREGNVEREENRANRLTFGARSEVPLPFGGAANQASINIMTFIDELQDVKKDARDLYDFLSEASHPNLFQNSYFQLAGPPLSNWSNKKFKKHAHVLLDKTVSGLESAISGIQTDYVYILKKGTEYIQSTM